MRQGPGVIHTPSHHPCLRTHYIPACLQSLLQLLQVCVAHITVAQGTAALHPLLPAAAAAGCSIKTDLEM